MPHAFLRAPFLRAGCRELLDHADKMIARGELHRLSGGRE